MSTDLDVHQRENPRIYYFVSIIFHICLALACSCIVHCIYVILELDSLSVVHLIQGDLDYEYPYGTVIKRVKNLLQHSWLVRIQKESNRATNFMVSLGHSLQLGVCYYMLLAEDVGAFLREVIAGVSHPILVP